MAHHRRQATGEAQFVDLSVQAAVFWTGLNAMISSAIDGKNLERGGTSLQLSTIVSPLVYPCGDGEVCLFPMGALLVGLIPWMTETGAVTSEWVDAEDWTTYEERVLTGEDVVHSMDELRAKITVFTKQHTKAELFEGALARGLTMVPVSTVADALAMEHLTVRDYWDEVQLPSGRTLRTPGPFAKASNSPITWTDRAPAIGEHTDEVLGGLTAQDPPSQSPLAPNAGSRWKG